MRPKIDLETAMGIWLLDESEGKLAKDVSGNDNHGEIQGTKWIKGKSDSALKFNGSSNRVVIPDPDSLYAKKSGRLSPGSMSINPKSTDSHRQKELSWNQLRLRTDNVGVAWNAYFRRETIAGKVHRDKDKPRKTFE